jgi:hypothetical protein
MDREPYRALLFLHGMLFLFLFFFGLLPRHLFQPAAWLTSMIEIILAQRKHNCLQQQGVVIRDGSATQSIVMRQAHIPLSYLFRFAVDGLKP